MQKFLNNIKILPRSAIRWLRDKYLAILDLQDRITKKEHELVPPRSLHFVGDGDFKTTGETFFKHFVDKGALCPNETVLDIGCGSGRMAIPLMNYIKLPGEYTGFDISKKAILWCQENISRRNPCFNFIYADIINKEYNPKGKVSSSNYRFPCDAASIDFAFATSVFTHLKSDDAYHYLTEIYRCLKESGRAFLTFFILDTFNKQQVNDRNALLDFSTKLENCYTIDKRTPERAIAYSDDVLKNLISDAGLFIREPIFWGSWSGRKSMLNTQDIVIVTKKST